MLSEHEVNNRFANLTKHNVNMANRLEVLETQIVTLIKAISTLQDAMAVILDDTP